MNEQINLLENQNKKKKLFFTIIVLVVIIVGDVDNVHKYLNQNKYKDINMCIKC